MRASHVVQVIQNMIDRRGDREFTVQIHVNGKPVAEVPRMNLVCRKHVDSESGVDLGTMGFDLHLNVPGGG